MQAGWGKIAAACATQYAINRWKPSLLVNLGTCGGFEGSIQRGEILLVDRTIVYDILEQMGDSDALIDYYTSQIDTSWLGFPKCASHAARIGDAICWLMSLG
jgi:adenosylhomocysteine nucleosidase